VREARTGKLYDSMSVEDYREVHQLMRARR
jgi:hypothetical protein